MSDDVRKKLRELINTQGQQILSDPNKFTSLMLDLCLGSNEREINILASALTKRIPQHLQSSGSQMLTEELRSNLSNRLEIDCALQADAANWAVNTWAEALGMVIKIDTGLKAIGKQVPSPELKTTTKTQPEVKPMETPVIGVDCTVLDFGKVIPGTRPSKTSQVRNLGTGILMGKVSTLNSWIDISPKVFDVSGFGQTITITIDSSLLSLEKHNTGYINIESNGGPANIEIKVAASDTSKRSFKIWMLAPILLITVVIIAIFGRGCPPRSETQKLSAIPPVITEVKVSNISSSTMGCSAEITWKTDKPATSQVSYGTSADYGMLQPPWADTTPAIFHDVILNGLAPQTIYHYRVISMDADVNERSSPDTTFVTPAPADSSVGNNVDDYFYDVVVKPELHGCYITWRVTGDSQIHDGLFQDLTECKKYAFKLFWTGQHSDVVLLDYTSLEPVNYWSQSPVFLRSYQNASVKSSAQSFTTLGCHWYFNDDLTEYRCYNCE